MLKSHVLAVAATAVVLAGCDRPAPPSPQARPVRTVTVQPGAVGETLAFTGQVRAQEEISLAFRLDGRVVDRAVNVGDRVAAGQIVGRLDPLILQNALRQAQANLLSAQAQQTEARAAFDRQQQLVANGFATRARFDQAQRNLQSAVAQVGVAQAQLRTAQEQLAYTELRATAPGVVTAIGAWPGEVVRAGQMVAQVALESGRDAVFDVPAQIINTAPRDPVVELSLTEDPNVRAEGRVREVAPQADPATRTFRVKVRIVDPPEAMRLGATVAARVRLAAPPGVRVPASALMSANGNAAVWVVAAPGQTVSLRSVVVLRHDPDTVVIRDGLAAGDVVVIAGVQALRPGQPVRRLEGAAR